MFRELRRNQKEFFTVGFQLEDLGKFRIHTNKMYLTKELLISQIRKGNSVEENKQVLSNLFKFRHTVREYYNSRKYKERFGS